MSAQEYARTYFDDYTKALSTLEYVYPESIGFGLLTEENIKSLNPFPMPIGDLPTDVNKDPLLEFKLKFGPQEAGKKCETCGVKECIGHYGIIQFPVDEEDKPLMIYNPLYIPVITKILSITCLCCYKISIPKRASIEMQVKLATILSKPRSSRLNLLFNLLGAGPSKYIECVESLKTEAGRNLLCPILKHKVRIPKGEPCRIVVETADVIKPKSGKKSKTVKKKDTESESEERSETDSDDDVSIRPKISTKASTSVSTKTSTRASASVSAKTSAKTSARASLRTSESGMNTSCVTGTRDLMPDEAHKILTGMDPDDYELIGFTKKEVRGFFMTSFIVIPDKYRPRTAGGKNHKLTTHIADIIRTCHAHTNDSNSTANKLCRYVNLYQKTWADMVNKKKGILKNNIYGKRADVSSARSVIVPAGIDIPVGWISVPEYISQEGLGRKRLVTADNIKEMQALLYARKVSHVKKLTGKYAGSLVKISDDNFSDKSSHILDVGDVIMCHLKNGDLVVTGRQPTMNKQNVFGVYAKITPGSNVTGIDINYTGPLAADYDGDTMYMFRAQFDEAEKDLENMLISMNIRTYQNNTPIYALTYNAIVAAALLTFKQAEGELKIDRKLFQSCIESYYYFSPPDEDPESKPGASTFMVKPRFNTFDERLAKHGVPKYSARGLFSTTLPENFRYTGGKDKNKVVIKDGILIQGMLTAVTVGTGPGSIVDRMSIKYSGECGRYTYEAICANKNVICDEEGCKGCGKTVYAGCKPSCKGECGEGWKITRDFINDATKMLAIFLDAYGFSITYTDCEFASSKQVNAGDPVIKLISGDFKDQVLSLKQPDNLTKQFKYDRIYADIMSKIDFIISEIYRLSTFKPVSGEESVKKLVDHVEDIRELIKLMKGIYIDTDKEEEYTSIRANVIDAIRELVKEMKTYTEKKFIRVSDILARKMEEAWTKILLLEEPTTLQEQAKYDKDYALILSEIKSLGGEVDVFGDPD